MIRQPPRSTLFPYNDALPILDRRGEKEFLRPLFRFEVRSGPYIHHQCGRQDSYRRQEMPFRKPVHGQHETRSEEHTSELQSPYDLVCRLLLEKKKKPALETYT